MKEKNNDNTNKKHSIIPDFLKIDFTKPVTARQQLAVMITFLFVSCLLFTIVYVVQFFSGRQDQSKTSAPDKKNTPAVVEESIPEESEAPVRTRITIETINAEELFGETKTELRYFDDVYSGSLILVNDKYSCRYEGENVEDISEDANDKYSFAEDGILLDSRLVTPLNKMFEDFALSCGEASIVVKNGYVSYEDQEETYNKEPEDESDCYEMERITTAPGHSEHQTGFAFDLDIKDAEGNYTGYDGQGLYSWINDNCGDYGFIQRYTDDKSEVTGTDGKKWHFRYVGMPHSDYMVSDEASLEEYIEIVKKYSIDKAMRIEDHSGNGYVIYYVEGDPEDLTEIIVPAELDYEISGDNYSGFIVTVRL